jgi:hypothetical protein
MLEPYTDHPAARQKIVLVSPGYIAPDFMKLELQEVEWPNVFARQELYGEQRARNERKRVDIQMKRSQLQRSVSTPTMGDSASTPAALSEVSSVFQKWNADAALKKLSQGVGVHRAQERNVLHHNDNQHTLNDIAETDEEVD